MLTKTKKKIVQNLKIKNFEERKENPNKQTNKQTKKKKQEKTSLEIWRIASFLQILVWIHAAG